MAKKKKEFLLEKTYQLFFDSVMDMDFPLEKINSFVPSDIMGYGTTLDERILGKEEFIKLIKRQRSQAEGELEWVSNPVFQRISKDGNTALFVEEMEVTMKMASGTHIIPLRISTILSFDSGSWQLIHWHGSQALDITDDTWHKEEWKQKNEALQKLVDEKTAKLAAKNRELKVEASLERIRSKTNAMQESSQLGEVIKVVFEEAIALDIGAKACDLIILDKQSTSHEIWISGELDENGAVLHGKIQHIKHFHHDKTMEAWKRRRKLRRALLKGRSSQAYMKRFTDALYDHNFPPYVIDFLCSIESVHHTDAYMKYGLFRVASVEPLQKAKEDYLKRFAEVFEQTYTRFLDLQKAEAQAREAQIEAALERVRSASMAMHHSKELVDVALEVNGQILELGIKIDYTQIFTDLTDDPMDGATMWMASVNQDYLQKFRFPYLNDTLDKTIWGIRGSGESLLLCLSKGQKNSYLRKAFKGSGLKNIPDDRKKALLDAPGWASCIVALTNSSINYGRWNLIEFTREEEEILVRFSKVFEQSYTRFLDLQKAEEQTREAEIELAIERVRARAMAMQSSDELADLIITIFQELQKLDMELTRCLLWIFNPEDQSATAWMTNSEDPDQADSYHVPHHSHPAYKSYLLGWKNRQEKWEYVLKGKAKERWDEELVDNYFNSLSNKIKNAMKEPKRVILSGSFNQYGVIQAASLDPLSDENQDILRRFSQVFEQTYTRFLDLQKAEEQAREAKIEAALERVRSASMAMHDSQELRNVIKVISQQLKDLDFDFANVSFLTNHNDDYKFWLKDSREPEPFEINTPDSNKGMLRGIHEARKSGISFFTDVVSKQMNNKWLEYIFDANPHIDVSIKKQKRLREQSYTRSVALCSDVSLILGNYHDYEYKEDENKIILRFAKAFGQAYTRFLDLKRAEEQAREAQIEVSLERIRARSMAMHNSDELAEVASMLYSELTGLGIKNFMNCGFVEVDEKQKSQQGWSTLPDGSIAEGYYLPLTGDKVLDERYEAWKQQSPVFYQTAYGAGLKKHMEFVFETLASNQVKEMTMRHFPDPTFFYCYNFSHGYLHLITDKAMPEHEAAILVRFTNVFEQTYTRFLDLQKAEEQAREARIESSLEKIRAASLAMHNSDEINGVLSKTFKEYNSLGIKLARAVIWLYHPEDRSVTWWASNPEADSGAESFKIENNKNKVYNDYWRLWQDRQQNHYYKLSGKLKSAWDNHLFTKTDLAKLPKKVQSAMRRPDPIHLYNSFQDFGVLFVVAEEELAASEQKIVERIANVFQQAWTRFTDLKKAEAQAKEAQIEAALERVRGRSMAMHNSNELSDVAMVLNKELRQLGYPDLFEAGYIKWDIESKLQKGWLSDFEGKSMEPFQLPIKGDKVLNERYKAWENQNPLLYQEIGGKALIDHVSFCLPTVGSEQVKQQVEQHFSDPTHFYHSFFAEGAICVICQVPLTEEQKTLLIRFTKVFKQTYTRFLDLQKSEAQAREAQIEVALERVRARTMAMHKSSELSQTVAVLFEELKKLGDAPERMNIGIIKEGETSFSFWATEQGGNQIDELFKASIDEPTTIAKLYKAWKSKKKSLVIDLSGKELKQWIKYLRDTVKMPLNEELVGNRRVHSGAFFPNGVLLTTTPEPVSEAVVALLLRFADVFKLTYTRFLDLQKAEEQAKEAQIEAALERIRAQAMAMQESTDLLDIVVTMRTEFVSLGHEAHYFWHMRYLPDIYEKAMTSGDGAKIGMVMELPRHIHGDIPLIADWEKSNRPTVVYAMDADTAVAYITKMITLGDFKQIDPQAPDPEDLREIGGYTFVMARTTHGEIGFSLPGIVSMPPEESIDTIIRFASVFDLAYRRFEDLLAAEAQAREAVRQSSLDRVRAEIASMRSTKDLERITPLVWQELTTLGVPFFRCGMFIVNEEEEMVHAYLSTPEGQSLAALHLSFDDKDIALVQSTVKHWRSQSNYTEQWTAEEFIESTKLFLRKGQIKDSNSFQAGETPPENLVINLVPFKQGMLYAGSESLLIADHLNLVKDLADAFAVAYARYEDFVQLEEAKGKVENTLTDLKSAQSQLVHAEKMASLGELTAGIAHEIQNPLNFVNNFSDVNKELMEELLEELANGDMEEVKAIAQDIIENDAKIVHHGKRAEGIVKGMLQHSRTSSGEKELTDINVLADEYLRLSYHGLRAKDKSFNADFKLDLDKTLPKINVVPQDLGRVLLNMINNAFHAVKDVDDPMVEVSTRSNNETIEIIVQDNGTGIPEDIKDKIFQPFFTTKATGEGTGLGLSLSYDIITKGHGGDMMVESKVGEGSKFIITLNES